MPMDAPSKDSESRNQPGRHEDVPLTAQGVPLLQLGTSMLSVETMLAAPRHQPNNNHKQRIACARVGQCFTRSGPGLEHTARGTSPISSSRFHANSLDKG
jgi:hypothetical protein